MVDQSCSEMYFCASSLAVESGKHPYYDVFDMYDTIFLRLNTQKFGLSICEIDTSSKMSSTYSYII